MKYIHIQQVTSTETFFFNNKLTFLYKLTKGFVTFLAHFKTVVNVTLKCFLKLVNSKKNTNFVSVFFSTGKSLFILFFGISIFSDQEYRVKNHLSMFFIYKTCHAQGQFWNNSNENMHFKNAWWLNNYISNGNKV